MKILIVEDQENLAKLLRDALKKEGYTVDYVGDGEVGQRRIEVHHKDYDLVVLDLMLPKRDGFEVCTNIRKLGISIPILVLTAKDSEEDKVSLLNAGADDYLVKPFSFQELVARIRAVSRRPKIVLPSKLSLSGLELDPSNKTVRIGKKEIKLTLTEYRLLEYLMRHPDQMVKREDIASKVWDFNFDSFSNIVDVYVSRLRKKIGDGKDKQVIKTMHGEGYKIESKEHIQIS
ncbi:MAG: hypothetical protein A2562_02125 [Candidatus Nealsonbacteria bacterium RIFOXYD1_FULL_39_11]|nr:MAG: hypothetical protein A2562_02125 [Candidatus Nealsonbacteria bacterium RIFOXYD1_FULL_39_11]